MSSAWFRMVWRPFFLPGLVSVLCGLTLVLYGVLTPEGRWQGDEYAIGEAIRATGFHVATTRILSWSPRPVGEVLGVLYLRVVDWLGTPLVAPFLLLLWGSGLLALYWAARTARQSSPLLVAVAVLAMSLLLAGQAQMFYWPMAAASYVPCWAALGAMSLLCRQEMTDRPWTVACVLVIAAWSQEAGALTVAAFSLCMMVFHVRRRPRMALVMVLPLLASLFVLYTGATHRLGSRGDVLDSSSGLGGHWIACIVHAVPLFLRELVSVPDMPLWIGVPAKLLLLVALVRVGAGRFPSPQAWLWSLALLASAYGTIVLSCYEFGFLCCERHMNFRAAQYLFVVLVLGQGFGAARQERVRFAAMSLALSLLLVGRLPALHHDMALWGRVLGAQGTSWEEGRSSAPSMTLRMPPPGRITNGIAFPTGSFDRAQAPWWGMAVLNYFHKEHVTFVQEQ